MNAPEVDFRGGSNVAGCRACCFGLTLIRLFQVLPLCVTEILGFYDQMVKSGFFHKEVRCLSQVFYLVIA